MEERGHISSILTESEDVLGTALAVGTEWFGADHVILKCLKMGIAVHHGALPTPYRKEIERLLRAGVLKLTISSPTLAQGLNLAATSLVFHGLKRNGKTIDISEFRNVVGRAGRAFIDIEGLVLYPMYDEHKKRRDEWEGLIASKNGREMESGLLRLVFTLLDRVSKKLGTGLDAALNYIVGQSNWEFPIIPFESARIREDEREKWPKHLMSLDTAIFSLLGDSEIPENGIESVLDEVLQSSLFLRRLERKLETTKKAIVGGLVARAKYIWRNSTATQRRGYFLAGVGLATGKELDKHAEELESLLLLANVGIDSGSPDMAVQAIIDFAKIAFCIPPFSPKDIIAEWPTVLTAWLNGVSLANIPGGASDGVINFIEQAFVFNLPWAMEAVRVRYEAHTNIDLLDDSVTNLSDYRRGIAVMALETGTMLVPAALLIQAGFASRLGAIQAIKSTGATFEKVAGLKRWLASDDVLANSKNPAWPTPESHQIWSVFIQSRAAGATGEWKATSYSGPVSWLGAPMAPGTPLRIGGGPGKEKSVLTADFQEVGTLKWTPNPEATGIYIATANGKVDKFDFEYIGPGDVTKSS